MINYTTGVLSLPYYLEKGERKMENRENTICQHCESYFTNLDAEQQKGMDKDAPGESCTNGMDVTEAKACPCFIHDGYHRSYIKGERNEKSIRNRESH